MKCPRCKKGNIDVLQTDPIECIDCGSKMEIAYCVCLNCFYSFRTNNGKFMDEIVMDSDSINRAAEDIIGILSDAYENANTDWNYNEMGKTSILDSLYTCIKCGANFLADPDATEYKCPFCGTEWEILKNE